MNDTTLPSAVQEKIVAVLSSDERVRRIILYGSRAKKTNRYNSDIDLSLDAPGLDLRDLFSLENRLDDLLLPWKIDLSILQHIDNPDLLEHIERVGVEWLGR